MAFESLADKLQNTFKKLRGKGKVSEKDLKEAMREVKLALLEADVNFKVVKDFIKNVSERAAGSEVMESLTPAQQVIKIVNEELIALMGSEEQKIKISPKPPTVIMMVGLQGAGKTTTSAKLAGLFRKQGKRPLLCACDVYRVLTGHRIDNKQRFADLRLAADVFQLVHKLLVNVQMARGIDYQYIV